MPRKVYPPPRAWLPEEEWPQFGRTAERRLNWLEAETPLDQQLLHAAKRQHNLAIMIHQHQILANRTTEDLAEAADVQPNSVRMVLNGTKHADLATLFVLSNAVDLDFAAYAQERD